jgi:hypothetical protein
VLTVAIIVSCRVTAESDLLQESIRTPEPNPSQIVDDYCQCTKNESPVVCGAPAITDPFWPGEPNISLKANHLYESYDTNCRFVAE